MQPISELDFQKLITAMENFLDLSPSLKIALRPYLTQKKLPAAKQLLNIGQTQHMLWFLISGLARESREEYDSPKETTSWFWSPGDFVFTDPGLFAQEPSEMGIQLMEDSNLIGIAYLDWKALMRNSAQAEDLTERIRSHYARIRRGHADEIKYLSTLDRYLARRELLEELFTKIKLRYLAEYMGMSTDTLGKLRSRFARRQ